MNWVEKVVAARRKRSFSDAMTILEAEKRKNPDDPQVYYQIASTHDSLGKEKDAVPAYLRAIELGLEGNDLESAYLGLGSTYRSLGQYKESKATFETGIEKFPHNRALKVFYSLTLFNLNDEKKCVEILLNQLLDTTNDSDIKSYEKALRFYSNRLEEVFE